jgi:hypothetical protein
MRFPHLLRPLVATVVISAPVTAADLTKLDRTLVKEPAYQSKPTYCLLVFGPEAKTRIWLVVDGDVLYVDRNGNGDLTEKGESIQVRARSWDIGEVLEADGKTKHAGLKVANRNGSFLIMLRTSKGLRAEVGNEVGRLQFSGRSQDAPVVHLAGPLTVLLRERAGSFVLAPGTPAGFIALIGTPGLGEGSAVYYDHEAFASLKVVGEAAFPPKDSRRLALKVKITSEDY